MSDSRMNMIAIGPSSQIGPVLGLYGPVISLDDRGREIASK